MFLNWQKIFLFLIVCFCPLSYWLQVKFGNWLYKNHNHSWLRKIWWSEYDFYRKKDF